jgi:hypothetical protein
LRDSARPGGRHDHVVAGAPVRRGGNQQGSAVCRASTTLHN